jgi:hypothetical protein
VRTSGLAGQTALDLSDGGITLDHQTRQMSAPERGDARA